ncbi:WYL domain-containing protein [Companilactobacillus kimchii]|uniref:WYL domain-containing protein n=2 Tax=Companilactobacillus kimchii TaxID=2801452 RepID=A0A210P7X2_9LACO|nr:WYL domain-containing protein [Companilactobacillus kimchii]KAE9557365.1 hypothetical protein ATN91_04265 [Companilactobacillus kimchii]OWF32590.1 hypothetical protein LKACC12383_01813 [Companilactobacillus kimchii]GEO47391.1 hypothetical protein LKI01_13900 [Companilactobacillus paralimentarius]
MTNSKDKNSQERVLTIMGRMMLGEKININNDAERYGVSRRTILRDLSTIKHTLIDKEVGNYQLQIKYNEKQNNYSIFDHGKLSCTEAIITLLPLLGSELKADSKLINRIQKNIISLVATDEKKAVGTLLASSYESNGSVKSNNKDVLKLIHQFIDAIINRKTVQFTYNGQTQMLKGVPISIFSKENHYYILTYVGSGLSKNVVYRIDQFQNIKVLNNEIKVPREKLEDRSQIGNKNYVSNSGEEIHYRFLYLGNPQDALNRLPDFHISGHKENGVIIEGNIIYAKDLVWVLDHGKQVKMEK